MTTESVRLTQRSNSGGPASSLEDGSIRALHALADDRSQDQFAEARTVNWQAVRERCEALLGQASHLEVAVPYVAALLELEGLPGLVRGLELVAGFVTNHWTTVGPWLDPDDHDDPTARIGLVDALAAPIGTYGDRWQVLLRLRRSKLRGTPLHGPLTLGSILACAPGEPTLTEIERMEMPTIQARLRELPPDELDSHVAVLESGRKQIAAIEAAFASQSSDGRSPNLSALDRDFAFLLSTLRGAGSQAGAGIPPDVPSARAAVATAEGEIRSSEQVLAALDRICRYYEAYQPASPLPLLLQRVQRLVRADFLTIVADLAPNALGDFKAATGFKEPASRAQS